MEHYFTLMEGVAQRIVLRFETPDGEPLPCGRFDVSGGASVPGCASVPFYVEPREGDMLVTVPGLCAGGLPWLYMVTARDVGTGVVWCVLRGEISVEKSVGELCGVAPGELEAIVCLNNETLEVSVEVGESTASCSVAVEKSNAAAEKAEAAAVDAREAWNEASAAATEATTAAAEATAAARPAVMLLLRGYCEGNGGAFTVDMLNEAIVVHTDRWSEGDFAEVEAYCGRVVPAFMEWVAYNHNMEVRAADINKYAECKTREDVLAVNADYLQDLTSEGEWVYPLPSMTRFESVGEWWTGFFYGSQVRKIKGVFPSCTYAHALIGMVRTIEEVDLEFPIASRVSATCRYSDNYKKVRIIAPNATYFAQNTMGGAKKFVECEYYAPKATDLTSLCSEAMVLEEVKGEFGAEATILTSLYHTCRKLRKFPTYYPKASTASNMFANCEIPGEAAIAVLDSFPAYASGSHPVTMGIHVDYQSASAVLDAIENAEAKGWTVAVQWNGTATAQAASTWGLRRRPIYAKVIEIDLPDSTPERVLDWGHYVTNWEANGYAEFGSVEEAREFFGFVAEEVPVE